jgi:hypothetical protein
MIASALRFALAVAFVLGGVWETVAQQPSDKIERMQLLELAQYISSLPPVVGADVAVPLTKRLYEIAFYDNHIPEAHRKVALNLLSTVKNTYESAFKDKPEVLATYRSANRFMEENVRRFGVGSLAWLIREQKIPGGEIVQFVARPEHAHLLAGCGKTHHF